MHSTKKVQTWKQEGLPVVFCSEELQPVPLVHLGLGSVQWQSLPQEMETLFP